jgi:hypothetical protein
MKNKNTILIICTSLLALWLAAMMMMMMPVISAANNTDSLDQEPIIISMNISNNAQNPDVPNMTTGQRIKPWITAQRSNLKRIYVTKTFGPAESENGYFTDRDWEFIRKSMTDLTKEEQDRLIAEMIKIRYNTSTLTPAEQYNVSYRIGYYLINATERGKPMNPADLPPIPGERQAQRAAAVVPAIPLIAIGGGGIVRLLRLRNGKP